MRPPAPGRRWAVVVGLVVALGCGPVAAQKAPAPSVPLRMATWEELVPRDWDPTKPFRDLDPAGIREGSAMDLALTRELREVWDSAPTRAELNGARITLPGYVVPLDVVDGGRVTQFLLVPYFGACIHSPPPPANQIVHVTLRAPAPWRSMQAVWVSGTLSTLRQDSSMGVSGYTMTAERIEAYRDATR